MKLRATSATLPLLTALALAAPILAQNAVQNGDFTQFKAEENLWDGVDGQNFLAGDRRNVYAVTESGRVGDLPMPVSVNYVDVSGDRLPDLVTADPTGVIRAYINGGTRNAPKWTHGEIVPIFPPMVAKDVKWDRNGSWAWRSWRFGIPKLALYDWSKRGLQDLIFGNYVGDIVMIGNTGTPTAPAYAQPTNYTKVRIPISVKRPWGNLFAPCPVDWNKDGKPDLLVGEGSYSANAVYVLLNQSSGSEPKFTEEQRYYLCYGDGREQLTPTVADWNGDGELDVIVGDRKGTIGVYINPGNWKPGTELPLGTMVNFGNVQDFKTAVAPHAADYDGDGLFDLLIGKANGRIALALNKGSTTEPKFEAPIELRGVGIWTNNIRIPAKWTMDPGTNRGNLYGYISVDEAAGPTGGKVLKSGFFPSPNKTFKMVELAVDGSDYRDFFRYWLDEWRPMEAEWAGGGRAADSFVIRQLLTPLKTGIPYALTFMTRGKAIQDGIATVAYLGANEGKPTKFEKGERGSAKAVKDEAHDEREESVNFSSSGDWKKVEKTFTVRFGEKGVRDLPETTLAILEFKFRLPQYYGECEIADVQIVPKPK
jgi:hypothetical protein